jgi:GWxTD domain-containing protein
MKYLIKLSYVLAVLGLMSCAGSKKVALDPESSDFYETAQLVMSKEEKNIFNHLPDKESRKEFIDDFWAKRDPDPETEANEFKEEFLRRIKYANERFKEGPPGWKTDRGRIYIYLGHPDKIEEFLFHEEQDVKGTVIFWVYYRYNFGVKFVDKEGQGKYVMDPYSGFAGDLFNAIEMAKLGVSFEEGSLAKKFMNFNVRYDREKKEIEVSIPVKSLTFIEEEGLLKAEFEFDFHIYEKDGLKKYRLKESKSFEKTENEVLKLEDMVFNFPYDLTPGKYYFDVIIIGKREIGKARKIFEIHVETLSSI